MHRYFSFPKRPMQPSLVCCTGYHITRKPRPRPRTTTDISVKPKSDLALAPERTAPVEELDEEGLLLEPELEPEEPEPELPAVEVPLAVLLEPVPPIPGTPKARGPVVAVVVVEPVELPLTMAEEVADEVAVLLALPAVEVDCSPLQSVAP